ncbi:MAG: sigma regulator [Francisellaceae bacterium]|nr:sigma regulator [Francisellaceae bacterium]
MSTVWELHHNRPDWKDSDQLVDNWLEERNHLLEVLFSLTALQPFRNDIKEQKTLKVFCQTLMDYVALLEFEVFIKLAEAKEKAQCEDKELKKEVVHALFRNSHYAADFNNKYKDNIITDSLKTDLSKLATALAVRFDLEDSLIGDYARATSQASKTQKNKPK